LQDVQINHLTGLINGSIALTPETNRELLPHQRPLSQSIASIGIQGQRKPIAGLSHSDVARIR
jgi:hypothetical protein